LGSQRSGRNRESARESKRGDIGHISLSWRQDQRVVATETVRAHARTGRSTSAGALVGKRSCVAVSMRVVGMGETSGHDARMAGPGKDEASHGEGRRDRWALCGNPVWLAFAAAVVAFPTVAGLTQRPSVRVVGAGRHLDGRAHGGAAGGPCRRAGRSGRPGVVVSRAAPVLAAQRVPGGRGRPPEGRSPGGHRGTLAPRSPAAGCSRGSPPRHRSTSGPLSVPGPSPRP
jgi:hypothetical protein